MVLSTLRDWAAQNKVNVGFDQGTGMVNLSSPAGQSVSFKEGSPESQKYGLGFSGDTHYLDPSNTALGSALGLGKTQAAPIATTPRDMYQKEATDLLSQIKQRINQPYDYASDPYYQSQVRLAEQEGKQAGQQASEYLNQRGILNSTITADRVAQAMQDARTARLPAAIQQGYQMRQGELGNLLNLYGAYSGLENQEYTRQRQVEQDALAREKSALEQADTKLKNAWDRVKNIGYVDNTASAVLGLPVGTPSFEAQKTYDTLVNQLNIAKSNNEASMQRTQVSQAGAMARTQAGIQAQRDLNDIKRSSSTITNQLITDLLSLGSPEEAFSYLAGENGQNAATAGADLNKAMQAIRTKYPEYFRAQPLTFEDLYNEGNPQ